MKDWKEKLENTGLVCIFLKFHEQHRFRCPGCAGRQEAYTSCWHRNGRTSPADTSKCDRVSVYTPLCGLCTHFMAAD